MAEDKKIGVVSNPILIKTSGSEKSFGSFFNKTNIIAGILILIILVALVNLIFFKSSEEDVVYTKNPICGDRTIYDTCSLIKPYFCFEGSLVEKASVCKCPAGMIKLGDSCVSNYAINPKEISLKYFLRGEEKSIDFVVYERVMNYLSNVSRAISYSGNERPFRQDFKLKTLNDEVQREMLLPLVVKIQNMSSDENEQFRIAVSLVQNIPYGNSGKILAAYNQSVGYERYPYEVLYDMQGVCGEKANLLAFLLKELNYEVVYFYNSLENHESIGVRCPLEESLENSGYCFVETTGPSIITNNQIEYSGIGKITSTPEIVLVSTGKSLGDDLYEYKDAQTLIELDGDIKSDGTLNLIQHEKYQDLKMKYGLVEVYNA